MMKRKILIILEAMLSNIPVKIGGITYWLGPHYKLVASVPSALLEGFALPVDLPELIERMESATEDEITVIGLNIGLNRKEG